MVDVAFIGLSIGSILLLVSLGLAITYGSMGVINMAHGEMVMLGAYTNVLLGIWLKAGLLLAIPVAFLATGIVGFFIERLVVRRLYGRLVDTMLATWGVGILLQEAVRLDLGFSLIGIDIEGLGIGLQKVAAPAWLSSAIIVGDFQFNAYRAFIILLTAILTIGTWVLMYRTSLGIQVRAIMRNPEIAAACGVNVRRVNALTFAFGSGLAGVAGVMMSGFMTVSPEMGASVVVDGFLVVVTGGLGSLLGTVLAAGLLGEVNGYVSSLTTDVVARAAVFAVLILVIVFKPNGLFSYKGR